MTRPIHVLVIDDSALVRQTLIEILERGEGMRVSVASDPLFALSKMSVERPDVIVLDLELPRMDGLEFLARLGSGAARIPVVVCSAHTHSGSDAALKALARGAVEIVTKPRLGVREFLNESAVLIADAVRAAAASRPRATRPEPPVPVSRAAKGGRVGVVALGASTGGTDALLRVLSAMPAEAPGMLIVQHMPEGFTAALARRLDELCPIRVREATAGDRVERGVALIAPGNRHMRIVASQQGYAVAIDDGPLVSRHRPSVDVLFQSVAEVAGRHAVGVLMTGMGMDGARGLLAMHNTGAHTLAQDEATCVVFGMPKEAIALSAVDNVVSLDGIAGAILERDGPQ